MTQVAARINEAVVVLVGHCLIFEFQGKNRYVVRC